MCASFLAQILLFLLFLLLNLPMRNIEVLEHQNPIDPYPIRLQNTMKPVK